MTKTRFSGGFCGMVGAMLVVSTTWAATLPTQKAMPAAVVSPQAGGAPAQGMFPVASKPKLMKITLANADFSPGVVDLVANVQSDRPSESCQFVVNVMTVPAGNDTLSLQVAGPLTYHFSLPAAAQHIPLSTLAQGRYRIDVVAVALANPACTGYASANFQVKRKSLHITPDITGINIKNDGYDKVNRIWGVGIEGKSEDKCGYVIRFKHEASGKVTESTGISTLPLTDMVGFAQEPAYGEYQVSVAPWTPLGGGTPACMGTKTTTVRRAAPALSGLDFMKISYSNVLVSTLFGDSAFDGDGAVSNQLPKAIRMDMQFANQPFNGQNCAFTLTVSKGGVEKAVAYKSGDTVDVLAAIQKGPGWSAGEYTISAHASPLNGSLNLPSCLGKQVHKMTVVDGGAIASGINSMTHKFSCTNTWDSNSILSAKDKVYCDVLITTSITGAPCNYSMSVQGNGEAPKVYRKTHLFEGNDMVGFEMYRGPNNKEMMDQLHGQSYAIKVWASDQDKVGGSGCSGEFYNGLVHF